jgi:hypothetical protein
MIALAAYLLLAAWLTLALCHAAAIGDRRPPSIDDRCTQNVGQVFNLPLV